MKPRDARVVWCALALALAGCADEGNYYPPDDAGPGGDGGGVTWECYAANDCQPGQYCSEFHQCLWAALPEAGPVPDGDLDAEAADAEPYVPPESEYEFGPPASGSRSVYVALPSLDAVARVDSETLDIASVDVGDRPGRLATVPGEDLAVVLNLGSHSVSILRVEDGVDEVVTLTTPPRLNRLSVSPTGEVALAWFELEDPGAQDVGSFQDMAVITLGRGEESVLNVSVGFRPRRVSFTADGAAAHVVTEDGVSVLDLAGATEGYVAPTLAVTDDPFGEGDPVEVTVAPDGSFAFARWADLPLVRAVDLASGELIDLALPGVPTDLDLTEAGDRLIAVVRETSQIAVVELPGGLASPETLDLIDCSPLVVGSSVVTPDGRWLLGFTNALNQKAMVLVDLETGEVSATPLRKGVRAVALSPDGRVALILHNRLPGEPAPTDDFETQLDHRAGFSLLSLETLFVKLQLTDAEPGRFTFLPDSSEAYLIVADRATGHHEVDRIDLSSFLVSPLEVSSHPLELGNVPGTARVYVSQDHPMGRLSFIDVASGEIRTVTGFELNGQIIE